jgi:hypothetical protein
MNSEVVAGLLTLLALFFIFGAIFVLVFGIV